MPSVPLDAALPIASAAPAQRAPEAAAWADAAALRAWERLETRAFMPTQGLAFSRALIGTLLAHVQVELFSAGDEGGIGALVALCCDAGHFARWRMLGSREVFEPNDALCDGPQQARALAAVLARQSRPLSLDRVPATSALIPALRQAMRGRGLVSVRAAVPCPMIPLDERWVDPAACFNAGRRSDFRRAARKAEALGEVTYEVLRPAPDRFDALFDEAIAVEASSWKTAAGTAIASDTTKEEFFRAFFRAASERGLLRIAFMRIGGQAVAMQMAVEFSGRYWLFKIGFDERFAKCSPGTLLMLHTLGEAARDGLEAYEMLGNVEPWIAEFWTRENHACLRIRTYPFNPRGLVAFAQDGTRYLRERLAKRRA